MKISKIIERLEQYKNEQGDQEIKKFLYGEREVLKESLASLFNGTKSILIAKPNMNEFFLIGTDERIKHIIID